jgi:osmotically-inducible protein OsmY
VLGEYVAATAHEAFPSSATKPGWSGSGVGATEVRRRLNEYAGGVRRWTATVVNGTASITGPFDDATEQRVARALALTVPGVSEVDFFGSQL